MYLIVEGDTKCSNVGLIERSFGYLFTKIDEDHSFDADNNISKDLISKIASFISILV
jgi:hypothetical protein